MNRRILTIGAVVLFAALLATVAVADDQGVKFTPVGFIDDPGPFPASTLWDVSGDGTKFIAGTYFAGGDCNVLSYPELEWTVAANGEGDLVYNQCKISKDGKTVMADLYREDLGYSNTAVWNGVPNEWTFISVPDGFEPCGSAGHNLKGIGGNVDFATGLTWKGCAEPRAFLWDAAADVSLRLDPVDGRTTRGNRVSADGKTIGGWAQSCFSWRGARWDDGEWSWVDGQPDAERLICAESGEFCCGDYDCPEAGAASCSNAGMCDLAGVECVDGMCSGGLNEGGVCREYYDCP